MGGGLNKPFTREDAERILREQGLDIDHIKRVTKVSNAIGIETVCKILRAENDRVEKQTLRRLYNALSEPDSEPA